MPPPAAPAPATLTEPAAFGPLLILPAERRVLVQGQPVAVGARAFDLLLALAARRERVVGKDELMDLVWPGVVVEENNLAAQISALRKLLGAQAIATVAGRGYRFTLAASPWPAGASLAQPSAQPVGAYVPVAPSTRISPSDPSTPITRTAAAPGQHVLLAEDNKVNRLLLCRTLELQGWQVSTAGNGRQALDMLRQQPYALLLLDLEMPELDGFALLQLRSEDPALRDTPVIVTSSLDGVGPVARCIELGADDYLHKPVNATLLRTRVGACLERRQLRRERDALQRQLAQVEAAPAHWHRAPPAATQAVPGARSCAAAVLVLRLQALDALLQAQAGEDTLELLNNWHTLMLDALHTHAGQLQQATSDSLTVLFTAEGEDAAAPRASPSAQALRAARASQDMAEMLQMFNAERCAAGRLPLQQGAGLACGEVLLGWTGTPQYPVRACLGATVQRAQALAAAVLPAGCALLLDEAAQQTLVGQWPAALSLQALSLQALSPRPAQTSAAGSPGQAVAPVYGLALPG